MVSVCCSATVPTTSYQHLEPYIHLHIVTILNKIQEDLATSAPYEHKKRPFRGKEVGRTNVC